MKKTKVINSDMSRVIAQMGHFDKLAIGDAGMPVPAGTEKIDLAVTKGIPSFMDVLNNVLEELKADLSCRRNQDAKSDNAGKH